MQRIKNKSINSVILVLQLVVLLFLPVFITMDQSHEVNAKNNNNKRLELACLTTNPCLGGLCLGEHCSTNISTQHKNNNHRNDFNEIIDNQLPTTSNLSSTEGQMTFSNPVMTYYGNNSNCEVTPIASVTIITPTINDNNKNMPVNIIDNNLDTKWSAKGFGTYLQLNLHSIKKLCSIDVAWDKGDKHENNFMISTSKDGKTFTDILKGTSSGSNKGFENYGIIPQVDAKYVKITLYGKSEQDNNGNNNDNSVKVSEVRINTVNNANSAAPI
jgi:hypothetical protein